MNRLPALKAFLKEAGGAERYRDLRVHFLPGANPVLRVGTRKIALKGYDTTDALHALMRKEGFQETSLRDTQRSCADWAYKGQCYVNRAYMLATCPKSCTDVNPDTDAQCPAWAVDGKCKSNPVFMGASCSASCAQPPSTAFLTGAHRALVCVRR